MKIFNFKKTIGILLVAAVVFIFSAPAIKAGQNEQSPKRILAIFSFKQALPWVYNIEEGLRASLDSSDLPFPIELNVEHADITRYPEESYLGKVIDYYHYKYADKPLDLILALGDESVELMLKYSQKMFGDIPSILVASETETLEKKNIKPGMTLSTWGWDLKGTMELVQDVLPQTRRLFIISGTSTTDLKIRNHALAAIKGSRFKFDIEFITDFTASEMLDHVAALPENSAIFFLTVFRDINDDYFVPRDLMHLVAEKANAPTFGIGGTYMGHGIVGGSLLQPRSVAKRIIDISINRLEGTPIIDNKEKDSLLMFDWRQLKRWSISEEILPEGSIVKFRKVHILERYKVPFFGIFVLFLFQGVIVFYLLHQRRVRQKSEEILKDSQKKAQLLAGKLLTAQESERALIARELHDDITQQLAVLNIQVDSLEMKISTEDRPLKKELQQIGSHLGTLSSDIHMISRQLHPSILYDLGLVKALGAECKNFARMRGLLPDLVLDPEMDNLPQETGLCIYRILQEGLRNIGKYAHATKIDVQLYKEEDLIWFLIRDNGAGFDIDQVKEKPGIGISSMAERARLINGELSITSELTQGTLIKMKLDCRGQLI